MLWLCKSAMVDCDFNNTTFFLCCPAARLSPLTLVSINQRQQLFQ